MKRTGFSTFLIGVLSGVFVMVVFVSGAVSDRVWTLPFLDKVLPKQTASTGQALQQKVLTEESVVIDVAKNVSPAVVTVSMTQQPQQNLAPFFLDPFGVFSVPGGQQGSQNTTPQTVDIGSGFIVAADGLIVTNKHVVATGSPSQYKVVTKDNKTYTVQQIWRDPVNDLAILKIDASNLPVVAMGDSNNLQVGQFVIAIGTALGEFRDTVTTGVVSGLGRGITAGDAMGGMSEQLSNVIQTDAAINPGNSGGPLLNSVGQVVGVNVAVSQAGQNIGFALPINVVKDTLNTFNTTGKFDRAFLGVQYKSISKDVALLNNVPAGAYVVSVVPGSSAADAGVQQGDIVTTFDGKNVAESSGGLAQLLLTKKIGDKVAVTVYRNGGTIPLTVTLKAEPQSQ